MSSGRGSSTRRVVLRRQKDLAVAVQRLFQRAHARLAPHHKRGHHVGKDDHVADGHHRELAKLRCVPGFPWIDWLTGFLFEDVVLPTGCNLRSRFQRIVMPFRRSAARRYRFCQPEEIDSAPAAASGVIPVRWPILLQGHNLCRPPYPAGDNRRHFGTAPHGSLDHGLAGLLQQHLAASGCDFVTISAVNLQLLDLLVAGHVVHQVQHQLFQNHAQPARAHLALQRLAGDLARRRRR